MVPFSVAAKLEVFGSPPVTGAANALFDHTAQLAIFTPQGVSFSSESGELLADVRSPVPEPATVWLWLLGVLLLVGIGRRERDPLVERGCA
jgi:PEP-CTERM motif